MYCILLLCIQCFNNLHQVITLITCLNANATFIYVAMTTKGTKYSQIMNDTILSFIITTRHDTFFAKIDK